MKKSGGANGGSKSKSYAKNKGRRSHASHAGSATLRRTENLHPQPYAFQTPFAEFGSSSPAEAARPRPTSEADGAGVFAFSPWQDLDVDVNKVPTSPVAAAQEAPVADKPPAVAEPAAAEEPAAQGEPPQLEERLARQRQELDAMKAWAEVQQWKVKAEIAEFELQKARETNAFLLRKVQDSETSVKEAKLEAVSYRHEMVEAQDVAQRGRLMSEVARLKREVEEAKKSPDLLANVKRLEGEIRALQKARVDWEKEKTTLEKHAAAWLGRLDEGRRKEAVARQIVAADVKELEHLLRSEGPKQFIKVLYRKFPPKDGQKLGDLSDRNMDRTLKMALMAYHSDRQDAQLHGMVWQTMCTQVSALINSARDEFK